MTRLSVVVQTVVRGAGMEMETLPSHIQGSRTREGRWKSHKKPRETIARHKIEKSDFPTSTRHGKGPGTLVGL